MSCVRARMFLYKSNCKIYRSSITIVLLYQSALVRNRYKTANIKKY